jgi:hypothetical protein
MQENWNLHNENTLGGRVEEIYEIVKNLKQRQNVTEEEYKDYRIMLNKSMKLQETVIETKFKDIRSQNDLDRKNINEIIRT